MTETEVQETEQRKKDILDPILPSHRIPFFFTLDLISSRDFAQSKTDQKGGNKEDYTLRTKRKRRDRMSR